MSLWWWSGIMTPLKINMKYFHILFFCNKNIILIFCIFFTHFVLFLSISSIIKIPCVVCIWYFIVFLLCCVEFCGIQNNITHVDATCFYFIVWYLGFGSILNFKLSKINFNGKLKLLQYFSHWYKLEKKIKNISHIIFTQIIIMEIHLNSGFVEKPQIVEIILNIFWMTILVKLINETKSQINEFVIFARTIIHYNWWHHTKFTSSNFYSFRTQSKFTM